MENFHLLMCQNFECALIYCEVKFCLKIEGFFPKKFGLKCRKIKTSQRFCYQGVNHRGHYFLLRKTTLDLQNNRSLCYSQFFLIFSAVFTPKIRVFLEKSTYFLILVKRAIRPMNIILLRRT